MTPDDPGAGPTLPFPAPAETPRSSHGTFPSAAESFLGRVGLNGPDTATNTDFTLGRPEPVPDVPGYEVLGELGSGGMGVVYKARELALNRVVALKMIRPDARPTPRDFVRFQAEAEAVAAVRHPNVVEVYSSGRAGDRPYFVMEFVAGGSLAARLAAGPLPPAGAAAVVAAVARGVHAAHEAGIVHRDIKPGNVLLAGFGIQDSGFREDRKPGPVGASPNPESRILNPLVPKVSDFGLAKRLDPDGGGMTRTVALMGTPAYMAPEQARGRGKFVGPEADVYALGVVLYECLTGRPPFRDDDPLALMRKVADEAPVPPRSVVRAVHPDLDLICRKCLAKEARDRYATAAELADDLDRFRAGRPVAARPIPWPVRAARWVGRNRAAAALAALAALVVTVGPAAVVWHRGEVKVLGADAAVREEARKRAEEQAERDKDARTAAEELAAARELVAVQGVVRRREADRPAGWTWANAADLARGAKLAAGDAGARAALRDEAAAALMTADLRPAEPVAPGFTAAAAVASPDGKWVALGPLHAWGADPKGNFLSKAIRAVTPVRVHVLLVDPVTGATGRDFSFPAAAAYKDDEHVPDRVESLAFSPDGARLFVGLRSKRVVRLDPAGPADAAPQVWDAPDQPDHLVVTADGAEVLGACGNEIVRWDAATGKELGRRAVPYPVRGFAVEPGTGAVVVAVRAGLGRVTDRGPVPAPADTGPPGVRLPAFLPGGALLVAARDGAVEVYDPATLRPVARFTDPELLDRAAHADDVTAVAVHPSGAYVATASANRVVKVWAVASGLRVATAHLPGTGPAAVAWSGDGRYLLGTGPGQTSRFEFAAPAAERFAGFHPHPLAAAVPAGGGRVVALGETAPLPDPHQVLYRTGPDGRPAASLRVTPRHEPTRAGLAVRPGAGEVAFTSSGAGVGRWFPDRPGKADPLTELVARCPAFTPDGTAVWAVVDSDGVRAWDADSGRARGRGWVNTAGRVVTGLGSLEALAAGRTVGVAGGADGAVHVLGPAADYKFSFHGERDPVQAVALAPDEAVAAAGTQGGKLRLMRLAGQAELPAVDAHRGGVSAVSFAPDGAVLATGGRDRAVRFWTRAADGRYEPVAAVTGLPSPVRGLAFDPDGGGLVVLLAGERAARVWDLGRLRQQLGELGLGF